MARAILRPVEQETKRAVLRPVEAAPEQPAQDSGSFLAGLGEFAGDAGRDLANLVGGVASLVWNPVDTAKGIGQVGIGALGKLLELEAEPGTGRPPTTLEKLTQPGASVEAIKQRFPQALPAAEEAGQMAAERAKEVTTHPVRSFLERPFSTALDVATVAFPIGTLLPKASKVGKAAKAVAEVPAVPRNVLKSLGGKVGAADDAQLANKLKIPVEAIKAVRKDTPTVRAIIAGEKGAEDIVDMGIDAVRAMKQNANAAHRASISKAAGGNLDAPTNLKPFIDNARVQIRKAIDDFTPDEFAKVRDKLDDIEGIASSRTITLDQADRFRTAMSEIAKKKKGVEAIRSDLITQLDKQFPGYRKAVEKSAENFKLKRRTAETMGMKQTFDSPLIEINRETVLSKMKAALDKNTQPIKNKQLKELQKFTDEDLTGAIGAHRILSSEPTRRLAIESGVLRKGVGMVPGVERGMGILEQITAPNPLKIAKQTARPGLLQRIGALTPENIELIAGQAGRAGAVARGEE